MTNTCTATPGVSRQIRPNMNAQDAAQTHGPPAVRQDLAASRRGAPLTRR